ncbi:MAG: apolipoprotein N-acyltransferase [Rickettsiales bacterium]
MRCDLPDCLTGLNRWQAALVLFAAGSLMALGFAPFHLWPVIFVSLPVLYLLLINSESRGQTIWRGFYFGYGYFMAGTWWIANALLVDAEKFGWLLPFCVFGLSAVMALWFMVFGLLVHVCRAPMTVLRFAALWVLVEYLRTFGQFGFPWNLLGYVGLASLPFAQMASVVGTYGLGFILALVGLLPVCWLRPIPGYRKVMTTVVGILILVICYFYGAVQLRQPIELADTMVRVVQPNVPQAVKGTREGRDVSLKALGYLTARQPEGRAPDVTVWPETAYPFAVQVKEEQPLPPVKLLLTGALRVEGVRPKMQLWNSVLAMDGKGRVLASYDKHQLVPFGEFVPLRSVLPLDKITPGETDFSRGVGPRTVTVAGIPPFSPLVCYEAIFPWMAVDSNARPAWFLNVTNDAWYGVSPGPYQHLDMARMRAIEQGLPLVRAANNGVSVMTDGRGRVLQRIELNQSGLFDALLPAALQPTVYGRIGECLPLLIIILVFVCSIFTDSAGRKINK